MSVEPFEPRLSGEAIAELRDRLRRTRWPDPARAGAGWEWGADLDYLRELCAHWAEGYEPADLLDRLAAFENALSDGVHFLHARADGGGLPIVLIHGWPSAPLEFRRLIPRLVDAGHEVVAPSLPGFGFSAAPERPLGVAGMARALRELIEGELGWGRYVVHGGDWGAVISARIAFEAPERVAGAHLCGVSVLPAPADLEHPPLSEAEAEFAQRGQRWRLRRGYHLLVQSADPDSLAVGLADSPAGLAAWLVPKYREWSDCDGDVERRFSKDDLCDLLTLYWATGTIASSMRIYAAERRDRWRLGPGERIGAPAAVVDFPAEMVRAPREWAERMLADLRRFTEMPRGGHFAAFEEPELLAEDLVAFAREL